MLVKGIEASVAQESWDLTGPACLIVMTVTFFTDVALKHSRIIRTRLAVP